MLATSHYLFAQTKSDSIPSKNLTEQIAEPSTNKQKFVELKAAEVIAIRGSAKAPFSKTTLSKKDIESQNLGQDIPFLLNQTPSIVVSSDAGNGVGYTGIKIRGTDASRINMTINGIPYNDAESQGLFLVNLPDFASSVSSVEIQRGVGSSSNGAGAFGATLSFSTNELIEKPTLEFNNSFGSFNTLKNTLKLSTGLQKNVYFDARISQIESDGYINRASSNLQSAMATIGYLKKGTSIKLNAIIGKEKTYQAWYGVSENDLKKNRTFNVAGTEKPNVPYHNETDNYKQNHYQFIVNQKINNYLNFSAVTFLTTGNGYYEQYKANQNYSSYGLPNFIEGGATITKTDLIRQLWLDNNFYGQTLSLLYTKNKTNFTVGSMISKYDGSHFGQIIWAERGIAKNYKWYDLDATKKDNNLFAKWQYDIDTKWSVYSDLQYRNVNYTINGFRNNPAINVNEKYNFVNPKFGVSFYDAKKNIKGALSYAKANKEPNRDDFEANIFELPKPEQLNDFEFNVSKKVNKRLQIATTLFYMHYIDQLILTGKINDVGAYTRQNIKNSYRTGLEFQMDYKLSAKLKLAGNLSLSKNKINAFTEYIDDYDNGGQIAISHNNTTIAFSPSVVAAATITYQPVQNLEIKFLEKYVGKQYLDNTQNNSRKLNPYFVQDILIHYNPTLKKIKNCSFLLQVNNVFNKKYEPNGYTFSYFAGGVQTTENFFFPMAGINFMVGVNIKLDKR